MINLRPSVLLPLFICLCSVTLWSQTDACSLRHHDQHTAQQHRCGFLPVLGENFTDPELETNLTRSYNAIFFQITSTSPEQLLHAALDQVKLAKTAAPKAWPPTASDS
jgi:hypothetical protein